MTTFSRAIESKNIAVQRGNTESLPFRFMDGDTNFDLTGATIVFRAAGFGIAIRKTSADDVEIATPANGHIVVPLTAIETRQIQPGKSLHYEIEYRKDDLELTLVQGSISAAGGTNDDA